MEQKKEKRFFSQHIIGGDSNVQDEWVSKELKNNLKIEKSEEETLENTHPLKEKNEIIHEKRKEYLSKKEKYMLIVIDSLLSTTTIGPLVVSFWCSTWTLMDFYGDMFPFWLCFTFGIVIHTMLGFLKYQFYDYVSEKKKESLLNRIVCQFLRITYTYVFGMMCVMHWRGGWILLDEYFNVTVLWINVTLTTSFLGALMTFRCIRNLLAPPFVVSIDNYSRLFIFPSLCKQLSRALPNDSQGIQYSNLASQLHGSLNSLCFDTVCKSLQV